MDTPAVYHNPINGEYTKILETSAQTGGVYSLFEVSLKPGGGNPLHFHKTFSEAFYPVKGILGVQAGEMKHYLNVGEHFTVLPFDIHRFFNDGPEEIIFRVKLTPGQPDFENFLKALFGLVQQGKTFGKNQIPKNIFHTAILYHWGDTHPVNTGLRMLSPLAAMLYKIARKTGIEKKLLQDFCG